MENNETNAIQIKELVSFNKMCTIVRDVAEELFDVQGEYIPEHYDYIFWVNISQAYAGYGAELTADEFLEKLYTGWMDQLRDAINMEQFCAIQAAVGERIEARQRKNPLEPVAQAFVQLIDDLNKKINEDNAQKMLDVLHEVKEINADDLVKAVMNNQK